MWTLCLWWWMSQGWVFSPWRVTLLSSWPIIRPECLALPSHVCGCALPDWSARLGEWLVTLPREPAGEGWQTLQSCRESLRLGEGRQMVELNSEPPLYVTMKNDQPSVSGNQSPCTFKVWETGHWNKHGVKKGRKSFHKLPTCLCWYFTY